MRLLSLNVWMGRAKGSLLPFLSDSAGNTDVFCFQEVLDVADPEEHLRSEMVKFSNSLSKEGTIEDGRIFDALKETLGGFRPFLTEQYTDAETRLATFVSGSVKVISNKVHPLQVVQRQKVRGRDIWTKPVLQYTR